MVPDLMTAVLRTRHGGLDAFDYRTYAAVPQPGTGEVLINVAAAGVNNAVINTRTAWYSKKVTDGTNTGGAGDCGEAETADATWSGVPMQFPRIQGAVRPV